MQDLFLTNRSDTTFLDKLRDSLRRCQSFSISVSFIKKAGLILIEKEIIEALERGATGKIITSTYQNFTDIASLQTFLFWTRKYPNFECHIDFQSFEDCGFHSKGYLFTYPEGNEFLVGSSNITRFALLKNIEWNVSLCSKVPFPSMQDAQKEFSSLWAKTERLNEDIIDKYRLILEYAIEKWDMDYFNPESEGVRPNAMQRMTLKELRRNRDLGVKRSLVIAATASGKTYLAAFDAKNYDAKRLLFIVHRDTILSEAMKTFEKVFGAERSYGLYTGKEKSLDVDFLFATNTMMARHLDSFAKDEFDYIVFDECHHSVAKEYRSIMDYFTPGFVLGLTATPERMDNQDVFSLFENNVPYELRLRDAIINNLVVPFHYYAIRDTFADYSSYDKAKIAREISKTINVDFIARQIEKYRPKETKLKCIAFCSSIEHAKRMADEFSTMGYDAIALTGADNLGERIKAFHDLQDETKSLEILCAVDILNEGVDIPAVNMVLFLRPTESSTIFLQQLGRGLRKYENKEYLTVLDFIGNNYDRSVQIAFALGTLGKTTYREKAILKELIRSDFCELKIPGVEIFFDDLSKAEIIHHLNDTNFNRREFLKKDYLNFKAYLKKDTYPLHQDYLESDIAPDLLRFMKANIGGKNRSYYTFLRKIGEDGLPLLNDSQIEFIDKVSEMLPLVRLDEYLILRKMIHGEKDVTAFANTEDHVTEKTLSHALYYLEKKEILINNHLPDIPLSDEFIQYMDDLLQYGIQRYQSEFAGYEGRFKILGNYYKEQIQMIRLKKGFLTMKGTEFDIETGETYCYVGLNKSSTKEERLRYKDCFLSPSLFQWESETNTTKGNAAGQKIFRTKTVYLFVRKMKEEDGITLPFTYIGKGRFTNIRESFTSDSGKKSPTLLTLNFHSLGIESPKIAFILL